MLLLWNTVVSDWLQHGFSCTLLRFQQLHMKDGQKTVDAEVMPVCTRCCEAAVRLCCGKEEKAAARSCVLTVALHFTVGS